MARSRIGTVLCLALAACESAPPPPSSTAAPDPAPTAATREPAPAATSSGPAPSPDAAGSEAPRGPAPEFTAELARIDDALAAVLRRAEAHPKGWLVLDQAANLYLARARLSGDYDDYARAEETLARAFAVVGEGAGPIFTRVRLEITLHRLGRAAAELERTSKWAVRSADDERAIAAFRADLAFQQGRYEAARTGLEACLAAERSLTNLARLAHYRWKTGDFDTAEALYRDALALLRGQPGEEAAWLNLMLGLMDLDRGRHDDALAHYRDAGAALPGYWLVDEHVAEILTLQGKTDEALALYTDIIARTDNPEFMDAAAAIHRLAGRTAEADALVARARAIYEAQLARFPEAAYGHALDHFLDFGDDPARTVELAEANHRTRPNAEAKIALARAYLAAGRVEPARKIIVEALATPWNTADLHATAAEIFTATGDPDRAARHRERALAINPHALAD